MALWCRDLPTVTMAQAATPKQVTLVYPYYENRQFFDVQLEHWRLVPRDLAPFVSVIVVDDGSPQPAVTPADRPLSLRMFRVEVDVRWNWLAARNIGAHYAADGWLLLTDMDHVVPVETLRSVIYGQHNPRVVYVFSRQEHTGEMVNPHSASFLMTRKMFWTIGGYDETFSGHYGTDGLFRKRVAAKAPIHILTDALIRHEYVGDSSTQRYGRKEAQDAEVRRMAQRLPSWHVPKTLSFPYHEVTA